MSDHLPSGERGEGRRLTEVVRLRRRAENRDPVAGLVADAGGGDPIPWEDPAPEPGRSNEDRRP